MVVKQDLNYNRREKERRKGKKIGERGRKKKRRRKREEIVEISLVFKSM